MFTRLQFYFRNYFFTRADFSFDWLFFIKSIWWNQTKILNIKRWVSFCCCYGKKKNDRNLKNILWTHAIRTTTLLTPKFWPTPPTPFFWLTLKFYRPTTPTHPRYPRYLADSKERIEMAQENELINLFCQDTNNSMVNQQKRFDQSYTAILLIIFKVCRDWFCSKYCIFRFIRENHTRT